MQSKIKISLVLLFALTAVFSSCLKHDLPSYPLSGLDYINEVYFQYRWLDSNNIYNGQPVVAVENMNVTQTIDSVDNIIDVQVQVPAPNGDFDAYQRSLVTLDSIWAYVDVSPAANVAPVGDAPVFSYQGNYSVPTRYLVRAANLDSTRVWTINVTSFSKP